MAMKYEDIPQIVYPNGSFTQQWQEIFITGELYRCKLNKNQLGDKDTQYDISIKLDKEEYLKLKKMRLDRCNYSNKKLEVVETNCMPLTGLKKVETKVLDGEGNVVLDDEGEPEKQFSHYQITLRQNAVVKGKKVTIPVTDFATGETIDGSLNEGSKVSVLGKSYQTTFRDNPAMGLNLKEVKVHEAVLYEGSGGQKDAWEMFGVSSSQTKPQDSADEVEEESFSDPSNDDSSDGFEDAPLDFEDDED